LRLIGLDRLIRVLCVRGTLGGGLGFGKSLFLICGLGRVGFRTREPYCIGEEKFYMGRRGYDEGNNEKPDKGPKPRTHGREHRNLLFNEMGDATYSYKVLRDNY
jgi:hypothetical protein